MAICILEHLDGKGLFHMTPGLERIQAVINTLGLQRPPFEVVQIVGTNGKGSTSAFLTSLCVSGGLKTGTHTSPHFLSPLERICINGQPLPLERWQSAFEKLLDAGGATLSYFECITALAMVLFAEEGVDIAIMETGLGGTWDATTAITVDLVLFTSISMDHESILGSNISTIATDKAGAIRQNIPSISVEQQSPAAEAVIQMAKLRNSPLAFIHPQNQQACITASHHTTQAPSDALCIKIHYPEYPIRLSLAGEHQLQNSALALAAWRYIYLKLQQSAVPGMAALANTANAHLEAAGLQKAFIAGRMQVIPAKAIPYQPSPTGYLPATILDGGHNPSGLAALGLSLGIAGIAPLAVIFACLEDKDVESLVVHLRSFATGKIFVPPIPDNERAMPPEKLAARIGLNAVAAPSMEDAIKMAVEHMHGRMPEAFTEQPPKHPLVICGSLYLLSEFYKLFPATIHLN